MKKLRIVFSGLTCKSSCSPEEGDYRAHKDGTRMDGTEVVQKGL